MVGLDGEAADVDRALDRSGLVGSFACCFALSHNTTHDHTHGSPSLLGSLAPLPAALLGRYTTTTATTTTIVHPPHITQF